jgi:heavy-metal resistance protein CzcE
MKNFVPILAALALAGASLEAVAAFTEADVVGSAVQASAAQRTVSIGPRTRWVTVERGEIVKFVSNGREFAWAFSGTSSSFDLKRVAPGGTLDRDLIVYVWPSAQEIEDK